MTIPGNKELATILGERTQGQLRILPTEDVPNDPEVAENGCSIVAFLGGLNVQGERVWSIIAPPGSGPRLGPFSDARLFILAPDLATELIQVRDELTALREIARSSGFPDSMPLNECFSALVKSNGEMMGRIGQLESERLSRRFPIPTSAI